MSSRMVLTRKNEVVKGRWTIGGNQDKEAGMWETYSPTAMNLGHFMVIWKAVMQNLWLLTADVSAAFLQGEPLPKERVIYMRIPTNWPAAVLSWLQAFLGPAFRWDLVRVRKGIFGLPESPYLWLCKVRRELRRLGFKECRLLICVFVLRHSCGRLRAIISIHVDDALGAGDDTCEEIWQQLRDCLSFGAWS